MWHKNVGLISEKIDKMLMMLLPGFASVLCTSAKDISDNDKFYLSHSRTLLIFQGQGFESSYSTNGNKEGWKSWCKSGSGRVVKHLLHLSKVKGSRPATAPRNC